MRGDFIAAYFRNLQVAFAFLVAFPDLELADGTMLPSVLFAECAPWMCRR